MNIWSFKNDCSSDITRLDFLVHAKIVEMDSILKIWDSTQIVFFRVFLGPHLYEWAESQETQYNFCQDGAEVLDARKRKWKKCYEIELIAFLIWEGKKQLAQDHNELIKMDNMVYNFCPHNMVGGHKTWSGWKLEVENELKTFFHFQDIIQEK